MILDYEKYSGNGYAYKVTNSLIDSLMWETDNWYAYNVYLSNDGHYLMNPGPWPVSPIDSTDLALTFYKDGKQLKSYYTLDLIKDTSKVVYSASHYKYCCWSKFYPYRDEYKVITMDKLIYTFDITTGEIISIKKIGWLDKRLNYVDDINVRLFLIVSALILGGISGVIIFIVSKLIFKRIFIKT